MNRDLGGVERFYWLANQWSANHVVAIAELDGSLEDERLTRALRLLQQTHPLLQVRVLPDLEGRHPRFVRHGTKALPLRIVELAERFEPQLQTLIEDELNDTLDAASTMARVVYARGSGRSALLVTCLHIVADATSAMLALRQLLELYVRCADPTPDVERLPARPPYEALLPARRRGPRRLANVLRSQASSARGLALERPARLPAEAPVPLEQRRNGFLRRRLSPQRIDALRAACRTHELTVQDALTAALALAVAPELELRGEPHATTGVGAPVSLRAELEPAIGDELGSYVATLHTLVQVGRERDLWSVARQARADLARRRARDEHFGALDVLCAVCPGTKSRSLRLMQAVERAGPGNVCLSNIGYFDMPREVCGVPLRSAHWTAGLSVTGYFVCTVCTTPRGLELDFAYIERVVSAERAARIVERMVDELVNAAPVATTAAEGAAS